MRRFNRRMRLNAARHEAPRSTGMPRPASTPTPRSGGCRSRLGLLISVTFLLAMAIWLLWGQLQIGRVLLFGASASGTVVSVHQCSRVTVGNVIIVFADAHGNLHRETHSSYTPGCFVIYHEGETVTVRYVPSDPGVLMTQPELDSLWISVLIFGMGDVLFLGGGGAAVYLFVLPWVASRVSALRAQERM